MQNKPNFGNDKMNITLDMTTNYIILSALRGQKTKPIQSQNKPNLSQFKANLSQNKANSNPIQSQFAKRPKRKKALRLLSTAAHIYSIC
ncbi:MAG: hypothetical protein H8D56_24490 [Planctomycetes bacterium]|nr:hypothetical protein [Planctomycetota bacterium]MBL7147008.1 hypothetical protein [Phycisphaerae bacterium]